MDSTATFWLPPQHSTISTEIDPLFDFLLYASIVMFFIVVGLMTYFTIKYRRQGKDQLTSGVDHNLGLEIAWTAIPTVLVLIVFFWGFSGFVKLHITPANAIEIKTTGAKWFWTFAYAEGASSVNQLVVPVNRPVRLLLSSSDVLHSFYVPNFRIKMDVLPNRYTTAWFEATAIGEFDLFCTEYCGKGHSEMIGKVRVMNDSAYAAWLEKANNEGMDLPPAVYGKQLYTSKACVTCHSLDGSVIQGPSFVGYYGTEIQLANGTTVLMDENYIRESILNPQAKVHAGFQPVMPTFQGVLRDRQIDALIAFIKSLNESGS
ncbi:MAG: cytochrome c oxidase subunit II [candidate division Zixibacteria bacterium]|nr:cytochrome c oxidase subunit II [candidate division Zixibacteria bacterium]